MVLYMRMLYVYLGILIVYLFIGVWNVVLMLICFLECNFYLCGVLLFIDWGLICDCWFCSGVVYKE